MIPKIIHYCWFGRKPKPKDVLCYIDTWKKHLSDYKIKEWNEDNFDVHCCKYVWEAYCIKKYAFVSDYARLYALYTEGGIYLDTDVEVRKSFDPLLKNHSFLGWEDNHIGTGVMGAVKGQKWVYDFLNSYKHKSFIFWTGRLNLQPNPYILLDIIKKYGFKDNHQVDLLEDDIAIYPIEILCAHNNEKKTFIITDKTISIHHYSATWVSPGNKTLLDKIKERIKNICIKFRTVLKMRERFKNLIYISTFGKKTIRIKNGIQIEVGASNRTNFMYPLHDDTGDNISAQNEYYGELTGMYWIWKNTNIEDNDIIGFSHYNKALNISKTKAEKWIKEHDYYGIISLTPITIRNHPVQDEVTAILEILQHKFKEEYRVWEILYDKEAASIGCTCRSANMFITSGRIFKDYCCWLFSILEEMRQKVGDKPSVDPYMRRYCAYMGERLLAVYIESRTIPVKGVSIKYKKWWIPILGKLRRAIGISRNSALYKILYDTFGVKSQYGKRL